MLKEEHTTFFNQNDLDRADLHEFWAQTTRLEPYLFAVEILENTLTYDGEQIQEIIGAEEKELILIAEWAYCLKE